MPRQLGNVLSDVVLALSSFRASYILLAYSIIGASGFILLGVAASYGAFRFFQYNPTFSTVSTHRYYTRLATNVGISLLAAAYHYDNSASTPAMIHAAAGALSFVLGPRLGSKMKETTTNVVSGAGIVSIFLWSIYTWNVSGMFGTALYVLAALKFNPSDSRRVFTLQCMDIFHYLLALANVALAAGLMRDE